MHIMNISSAKWWPFCPVWVGGGGWGVGVGGGCGVGVGVGRGWGMSSPQHQLARYVPRNYPKPNENINIQYVIS